MPILRDEDNDRVSSRQSVSRWISTRFSSMTATVSPQHKAKRFSLKRRKSVHINMPRPSRQFAFSRGEEDHQHLYDKLEAATNLPGGESLARYNASCMKRCRPASGLNVGIVYLTKTHAVFYAHFVRGSSSDLRIALPLKHIVQVRKAWYGRLLPNGVLIRCKGFPYYLLNLCSKDEQKRFMAMISALIADAKAANGLVSEEEPDDTDCEADGEVDDPLPESEPEPDEQPDGNNIQVKTMKRVQFTSGQPKVLGSANRNMYDSDDDDFQVVLDKAIANVHKRTEQDNQQDSLIFFFSAFVLLFTTVCICAALYLLQLRISVVASHLVAPH